MSDTCGPGQKEMQREHCRDVAYIDDNGNPQKVSRKHWIVWKLEVNCLDFLIDIGLTTCYHKEGYIVANTHEEDNQMIRYRLSNSDDVISHINHFQGAVAKVGGNPFDLSPQVVLDYLAESGLLPTAPEEAE